MFTSLFLALIVSLQPPQAPDLPEPTKEIPVVFPAMVEAKVGRAVKIEGKSLGPITLAHYPGIRDASDVFAWDKTIVFVSNKEGIYWVGICTDVEGKVSQPIWVMIKVGIPPPLPPGPKPPNPPDPQPNPAPIPVAGLRVLIVYDPLKLAAMPIDQQNILFSTQVRNYLNSKTVVGPDNKTKEWRMWPISADPVNESKLWKDAFARPKQQTPWIIVSNMGVGGFEGPLPANIDETLKLIQKYEK